MGATVQLRDVLAESGNYRGALTLDWYVSDDRSQRQLVGRVPPIDRARTYLAWADRDADRDRARTTYARAADEYEQAGLVAQAAIAGERGGDFARARALWSRLAHLLTSSGADLYAAGLARFNLARTSLRTGDAGAAREAVVAAVHLLEEAADRYETIGQRERAFDCYQVLIAVGRESQEFEHVLEGYVNVIRILREDHLRYYALQSYEEAVGAAEKQGEVSAAATLARARDVEPTPAREGLGAVSSFATLTQARLWQEVARSPSLAQAARAPRRSPRTRCSPRSSRWARPGSTSRSAPSTAPSPICRWRRARVKHYARATGALHGGAQDLAIDARPAARAPPPRGWLPRGVARGSRRVGAGRERQPGLRRHLVLNPSEWSEVTRRRGDAGAALGPRGRRARPGGPGAAARPGPRDRDARSGDGGVGAPSPSSSRWVELYTILSPPLEHLYRRPEPEVRAAVVRALSRFLYKRTFITLREALADPRARDHIVTEAAQGLSKSCASRTPSTPWRASTASRSRRRCAPPRCARWPRSTPWRPPRCCSASSSTTAPRSARPPWRP